MTVPAITAALSYPLIKNYLNNWGPEKLMLSAGLMFGISLIVLAVVAADYAGLAAFITITCITQIMCGFATAGNQVAETDLIAKYYFD
jgi:hypothetical protein